MIARRVIAILFLLVIVALALRLAVRRSPRAVRAADKVYPAVERELPVVQRCVATFYGPAIVACALPQNPEKKNLLVVQYLVVGNADRVELTVVEYKVTP